MQAQSARSSAEPLEFRDVTKRYPGVRPAVDGLSLEVPAGEICVLVGPSGCGKTTAMRMVNRLIDITCGDILLDGRSVKERKPEDLRRNIGYVIQQIGLFPHRTIAENIATVPRLLGWDASGSARASTSCSSSSGSTRTRSATATRRSSRAASASASASPARSPSTRR